MATVDVKVSRKAIRALLTCDAVREDIKRRAEAVAAACERDSSWGGYAAVHGGASRARSMVFTIELDAVTDNARNQRLIRNLDAGA